MSAEPLRLHDPTRPKPPRKRGGLKLPNFLTEPQQIAVITVSEAEINKANTPHRRYTAQRYATMILLGLYAGHRVSEMLDQEIQDIDLAAGLTVFIRQGKNCKDRIIPLHDTLVAPLRAWIGERTAGLLFPGHAGKRLCVRAVETRLAILGKLAGLPRKLQPHTLRHTAAVRLLEGGADIEAIREFLGHSGLGATAVYLHCTGQRLRAAVARMK